MSAKFEQVFVHPSQFPDQVYQDYLVSFSGKQINHKFHYDSVKQSQKWLKIHQEYSPSRNDRDAINTYEKCFQKTAETLDKFSSIQLIGLGSGGGTKDSLLLSYLSNQRRELIYYPLDVSLSLAIISAQKARSSLTELSVQPIVCDLLDADDLMFQIQKRDEQERRIITFFGMIPNFYPQQIFPTLNNFLNEGDLLLLSANLAPGSDYVQGIEKILPQYDNELTKDWLITVLEDVGVNHENGNIQFGIKDDEENPNLKRVNADFELNNDVSFKLDDELIEWKSGDKIGLFFSYRYTTTKLQEILSSYGINILNYWEAANEEEGVYLCQKSK
ncbi:L-histidine N(alpha)-methyltransferase [Dapis sp. BLCC M172]|uniref:L-histidine N(alpha)-methyltransferase n=1 Tax=Dapis sp. BLCC M172 TaxID=2975281 RepID=UPI003CF12B3E